MCVYVCVYVCVSSELRVFNGQGAKTLDRQTNTSSPQHTRAGSGRAQVTPYARRETGEGIVIEVSDEFALEFEKIFESL
jgi:hypothetical protein